MRRIIIIIVTAVVALSLYADTFRYSFTSQPLAKVFSRIADEHPDIEINFIYNELENYKTSANVNTSDSYEALRRVIGLNPVTIIRKGNTFYIEALQHGKYCYTGRAIGTDNEPVIAATVMLLAPKDSTVITYGITDNSGRFSIPCDRQSVIAKLTSVGYRPTYRIANSFSLGDIRMNELPIQLKTVRVEADYASAYSDRTVYRPTQRQKNASANAIDLLAQMSIPQINVNPITKTIQLPDGYTIPVYIDFIKASPQDLAAMMTKDVLRVEFIAFPQDPRFKGTNYVLNFIIQKYDYGGYTRVGAEQWLNGDNSEGIVYSKFAYRKMTFDLYADENFFNNSHGGENITEQFRFTDLYGQGPTSIQRHSSTDKYVLRKNSNDIKLRAVYNTETTQFSNSIDFALNNTPHNDVDNRVEYSDNSFPTENTSRSSSTKDYAISYDGEFYHAFNKSFVLSTDASIVYGHNTLNSEFKNSDNLTIVNDAVENSYLVALAPIFKWALNDSHSFSISGDSRYYHHLIDYMGSSQSKQVYNIFLGIGGIGYDFSSKKIRIGSSLKWGYINNNIAGFKERNSYPNAEFYGIYIPAKKHQFQASFQLGRDIPEAYNKSPNMLQQDALMWYAGSPNLKDNSAMMARLNYTWLHSNQWQFGFNSKLYQSNDRVTPVFLPEGPDGTMLKKYMNSGDYRYGMFGLTGSAKLLGGKLAIKVQPQVWLRQSEGIYKFRNQELFCMTSATYYMGNFTLFGYYYTPSKYNDGEKGYKERRPSGYLLSLAWHHGPWHAKIAAYNFLRTNWSAEQRILKGQYYEYDQQLFNTTYHQRFSVSASYTFNYGKKVNKAGEISGSGTAESAILK